MLLYDRAKFLGLIFAIGFSTFLLLNQTSIFAGIMKRTGSQILDVTDAEVWVMDPKTEYFEQTKPLKETDLNRVRSIPGVKYAVRLFKGQPILRTEAGKFSQVTALGLDDATLAGAPRNMELGDWRELQIPDAIVIDKAGYQLLYPGEELKLYREVELNDQRAVIVGITNASAPFASFPVVHGRYSVVRDFVGVERKQLSFILVRTADEDPLQIARHIELQTGLRARTSEQFRWDCIRYYLSNTGIPVNFGITILIAIIIGLVVSAQTLFLFTLENLKYFGALKAIGVSQREIVSMILVQAGTAGFVGYSVGMLLGAIFFEVFEHNMPTRGIILYWQNTVIVAALIFFIVILASVLSVYRVMRLEPASVFRG